MFSGKKNLKDSGLIIMVSWIAMMSLDSMISSGLGQDDKRENVSFNTEVLPILSEHCYHCHGPDEAESGLRLDLSKSAYQKLDSGDRAIVPGMPQQSELLSRILSHDDDRMPPEGKPLSSDQISLLKKWISQGARYDTHWAYQVLNSADPPDVTDSWVKNEIDRFVLKRMHKADVKPSEPASAETLVRRLYLDLIGLPPSPVEVLQFVQDKQPLAYERLVDRLLSSKHFGERWGRHWLDKARYADSDGYEKDRPRPNAWRYRDWVIDAINRDLPLDQFAIEQLAGDLLPDPTLDQRLATAFHRQTLTNTEGGTDQEQFRVEATFDRTETTAAVWLGLTYTCARCHNHKYDQISQDDYFRLYAFFNDANETDISVPVATGEGSALAKRKQVHDEKLRQAKAKLKSAQEKFEPQFQKWLTKLESGSSPTLPQTVTRMRPREVKSSAKASINKLNDDSLIVTGNRPDKDKYTLVFDSVNEPITGIKLELLSDKSLPGNGPGRPNNGNFVLSQVRAYVSDSVDFKQHERIGFGSAIASFSQKDFSPLGALSSQPRSGWAIAPQMGRDHQVTLYFRRPLNMKNRYLQIVLDQSYGGGHTIGKFRVSRLSGFDIRRTVSSEALAILKKSKETRTNAEDQQLRNEYARTEPELHKLLEELTTLKENEPTEPKIRVRVIGAAKRDTKVLYRGDFLQPGKESIAQDVPVVLQTDFAIKSNAAERRTRLDLARWLVNGKTALPPRVMVNQTWAHLFGQGLVRTVNDFGVRGEPPTHPELLDWLAGRLVGDLQWSRKKLIRLIVTSATYRQQSRHRSDLIELDPGNRFLARQNRIRVSAEIVRDIYLSVGGLLSRKIGGPSVFPPLPAGVANLSYANNFNWKVSDGDDRFRRGMYTFFKRTSPHPTLISFDCPDSNTTRLARDQSNTPIQALITMNNQVFFEAAQALAQRVLTRQKEGLTEKTDDERLQLAMQFCLSRTPTKNEVAIFAKLLNQSRQYYRSERGDAEKLVGSYAAKNVSPEENAAWIATVRMIMNLDEVIVRN